MEGECLLLYCYLVQENFSGRKNKKKGKEWELTETQQLPRMNKGGGDGTQTWSATQIAETMVGGRFIPVSLSDWSSDLLENWGERGSQKSKCTKAQSWQNSHGDSHKCRPPDDAGWGLQRSSRCCFQISLGWGVVRGEVSGWAELCHLWGLCRGRGVRETERGGENGNKGALCVWKGAVSTPVWLSPAPNHHSLSCLLTASLPNKTYVCYHCSACVGVAGTGCQLLGKWRMDWVPVRGLRLGASGVIDLYKCLHISCFVS